jgi:cytochrome c oxidase cbb3-type subunit 3
MNRLRIASTLLLTILTAPLFAQAQATTEPGIWTGPNAALAFVALVQLIAIWSVASILKRLTQNTDYFLKIRKLRASSELKGMVLLLASTAFVSAVQAQSNPENTPVFPAVAKDPNTLLLLGVNLILLLVFVYLTRLLLRTIAMLMPEVVEAPKAKEAKASETRFIHVLTDAVPVEREAEVMLDHEYDGIRELDNNLPPWWVWMFYVTIIFAVVYLAYFHVLPFGVSQDNEYLAEVKQAEIDKQAYLAQAKNLIDENSITLLTDPADLSAGKKIYLENCQACHAADGGGGVGPNFTDQYWIHGGGLSDIFKTIKYGVPAKGMIAWQAQLKPIQMAQVTSYIKTLQGTTPLSPKEPQGEIWVENGATESPADSTAAPDQGSVDAIGAEVAPESVQEADANLTLNP